MAKRSFISVKGARRWSRIGRKGMRKYLVGNKFLGMGKGNIRKLPRRLTRRTLDSALSDCWAIESSTNKEYARKVKIYIRENWQELAEILDKYCMQEVFRDVPPSQ